MDIESHITGLRKDMDGVIQHIKDEFSFIAAGRASTGMVENINVDSYGQKMQLKGVATITIPEPQQIMIQPWDKSIIPSIESALRDCEMKFNPQNDGNVIRVFIPQPTEEKRKELVKIANKKAEEGRISLRNLRQDVQNEIKSAKESSEITEDDFYAYGERVDGVVKEYNSKIDDMVSNKEIELMKV